MCTFIVQRLHANEQETDNRSSEIYIKKFKSYFDELSFEEKKTVKEEISKYTQRLFSVLDSADVYTRNKKERINKICSMHVSSDRELYDKYNMLFDEYMQCSFDSAFNISLKCISLAEQLNDKDLIIDSHIKACNMFVSGGYFREADIIINKVDASQASPEMQRKFLMTLFGLEFENGFYFGWNTYSPDMAYRKMQTIYDKIIKILPDDSYEIYYLKASMSFYKHRYKEAIGYNEILLLKSTHDKWKYINTLGNMGYTRIGAGEFIEGMKYMVKSATLAIRDGSNNYSALRKIAELVYAVGDLKNASILIGLSMNNATMYNSKYRIIESSKGYPLINNQLRETIENERHIVFVISNILLILVILLLFCIYYILKQRKKVYMQAQFIMNNNKELQAKNKEIEIYNNNLIEVHNITSVLMSKMITDTAYRHNITEQFRKELSLKIKVKQFDSLLTVVDAYKKDLSSSSVDINEIILAFFPNFASQFNALLRDECKLEVSGRELPTEMKIFALWRLGIKKNENIANCMGYSLNTIKSYKTRILNSTDLEKEEFYSKLMEIVIDFKN